MDTIDRIVIDTDEHGFELVLTGDFFQTFTEYMEDGEATSIRLNLHAAAWEFANSRGLAALEDWAEQGREAKRDFDARPDADADFGYALDDPKHSTYFERMVDHAD